MPMVREVNRDLIRNGGLAQNFGEDFGHFQRR